MTSRWLKQCCIMLGVLALASAFLFCSNDPVEIEPEEELTGVNLSIADADGTPLSNVHIHKVFRFSAGGEDLGKFAMATPLQSFPNPFEVSCTFQFQVLEAGNWMLAVVSSSGDTVRTLASGPHQVGIYNYQWDGLNKGGRIVTNDIYNLVLSNGLQTLNLPFVKNRLDWDTPDPSMVQPGALSNAEGKVTLDCETLPFFYALQRSNESGQPLGLPVRIEVIELYLIKAGYARKTVMLVSDTTQSQSYTVTLLKENE